MAYMAHMECLIYIYILLKRCAHQVVLFLHVNRVISHLHQSPRNQRHGFCVFKVKRIEPLQSLLQDGSVLEQMQQGNTTSIQLIIK